MNKRELKKKRWTAEETRALQDLYESGDKACLPWNQIPERLNEEFRNGRTLAACQRKLYVEADKMRRDRGWDTPTSAICATGKGEG